MAAELAWSNHHLLGVGEPVPFLFGPRIGMRFSPDGKKVAYERGSAIEVRNLTTRTTVVIPHGNDVDLGPVWSPDSQRLVFRREPSDSPGLERNWCGGGERYCGPLRSEQPWALWTVALSDLVPHRIWQAKNGVGSVYYHLDQQYSPGQFGDELFWSADDRIAFVWEGDGWRHLYAVSAAGGEATLLTPGDGEVETAAISMDRMRLFYATNIGDLGRRHISSVGFDGSAARTLTSGDKSQWAPVPLAAGRLAYLGAGWADPPQVSVREASGATRGAGLPQVPASFPGKFLVKPELVEFAGTDGQKGLRAAVRAAATERLRHHFLARRDPATDAARLPLHGGLSLPLRHEPVPRESRLHRALGRVPQQHHARRGIPERTRLGIRGQLRDPRLRRRGTLSDGAERRRCQPRCRDLRPLVGRIHDRRGARAALGSLQGRIRHGRRPHCP